MTCLQCRLAESVELCPREEKVVSVVVDGIVNLDEIIDARSEINGLAVNEHQSDYAYACVGDGSSSVLLLVRNELENGIQLDSGSVVASGTIVKGVLSGRANCSTMEIKADERLMAGMNYLLNTINFPNYHGCQSHLLR